MIHWKMYAFAADLPIFINRISVVPAMKYARLLTLFPRLYSALPIIALVVILTGCVDADGSKIFNRPADGSGDDLHIYKADDFIEYTVFGTQSNIGGFNVTTVSGSYRVEWKSHSPIIDPVNINPAIPVLEQISTLEIGNDSPVVIRRLISQDPVTGSLFIHAFSRANSTVLNWVNDQSAVPPDSLNKITTLEMPLAANNGFFIARLNVFDNCDDSQKCNLYLGLHETTYSVTDEHFGYETRAGTFDTYKTSFNGSQVFSSGQVSAFPILLDLGTSCSPTNATFSGVDYIFPEIGIVAKYVTCSRDDLSGFQYNLEYDYSGGSISLPQKS